jgi:hypothetical protein
MSLNPYVIFRRLIPAYPLQSGVVVSEDDGIFTIELPGGGRLQARGSAAIGDSVFVRDGLIEGPAPDLPDELIEV